MVIVMNDIDLTELRERVLHALGHPVAALAERFSIPLNDTVSGLRTSYFQVVKRSGLTLRDVAGRMGISERQAKRLQKQLRDQFVDVERGHSLPTRI
ncbi:MAG: hypothetical protein ACI9OJ_004991, partial [Myxococcota bacterium]